MIFSSNNYSHWYNHRILIGYIATSTNSILPVKSLYKLAAVDGAVGGSPLSRTAMGSIMNFPRDWSEKWLII